jgi:para-nitrobenzyl esterase
MSVQHRSRNRGAVRYGGLHLARGVGRLQISRHGGNLFGAPGLFMVSIRAASETQQTSAMDHYMKNPLRKSLATAALLALGPGAALASAVHVESGALQGVDANGLSIYKGVPYAAAPVGEWRWREPQPVTHWKGVRKATAFAPACLQTGVSMPGETQPAVSEDCLYLNIWAPVMRADRRLPVFVWIHGGGYTNGLAAMPLYWGDRLAKKGVIVVTIAYRLGPLGFLAHPELTSESRHHSSGNYGLMDQIAALEWVHKNIVAFGGDPNRVTIAGQSSGSISVSILMASPPAKGLFQRAIGECGGLFEPLQLAPKYLLANAEKEGEKFAASLGAASIKELRQSPAARLTSNESGITHPVIEPYLLPHSPYEAFVLGQQNDFPLLLGSNAEEARAMVDVSAVTAATFESGITQSFGPLPPALMVAYTHSTDEEARTARLDFERDLRFGWDMWAWARLQATTGHSPVYYYSFQQKPPYPKDSLYAGWGASQFADLWYVFDHLDQYSWAWTSGDRRLAEEVSAYWVNFAKSGDPNGKGLPTWPAFENTKNQVQYLAHPITTDGVLGIQKLKVFDSVYSEVRGKKFGSP